MSPVANQPFVALGGLVGAALLCAGCTQPATATLRVADEPDAIACAPQQDVSGRAVFSLSEVDAIDGSLTVTSLTLVEPERLTLLGFDLVEADAPESRVVTDDYDRYRPSSEPNRRIDLGRRYIVRVGVEAGASGGSARALAISFVDPSGREQVAETRIAMQVAPKGEACRST